MACSVKVTILLTLMLQHTLDVNCVYHEYAKSHPRVNETSSADSFHSLEAINHEIADRYIDILTDGGESVVSTNDEVEEERAVPSEDTALKGRQQRRQPNSKFRSRNARQLHPSLSRRRARTQRRRLRRLNDQGLQSHVTHVKHAPQHTKTLPLDTDDQWEDESTGFAEEP